MIIDIDPKGLTETQVQSAIDAWLNQRQIDAWNRDRDRSNRDAIAETRRLQGQRLRLVNAIKRGGVSVESQSESWRTAQVRVPSKPNDDGWYAVGLSPMRYTNNQTQEQRDGALVALIAKLQENKEIELKIETRLETAWWREDRAKELNTYYLMRQTVKAGE